MKSHIKEIRETKGLTQIQVANQAKVGLRSYQRYESGKRLPGIPAARRIASVLNCTVEEIFPVYEDAKIVDRKEPSQ